MAVPVWLLWIDGLDMLAIIWLVGLVAARLWLLPSCDAPLQQRLRRRLHRQGVVGLIFLSLTCVAVLVGRCMSMSGAPLSQMGQVVPQVLALTDFGSLWWWRVAALVALWFAWCGACRRRPLGLTAVMLSALAIEAYARCAAGHAGAHGNFQLSVWVDTLHLLSAGLWAGVVLVFVSAFRGPLAAASATSRAGVAGRLSRLATLGLGLVVVTGVYNSWQLVGSWQALFETAYGRTLDIKLLLVVLMALLGACNHFRHVPALKALTVAANATQRQHSKKVLSALSTTVVIEACLVLLIIAVAAVLINGMPPAGML